MCNMYILGGTPVRRRESLLIVTSLKNLDVEKSLETLSRFFLVFLWKSVKKQVAVGHA